MISSALMISSRRSRASSDTEGGAPVSATARGLERLSRASRCVAPLLATLLLLLLSVSGSGCGEQAPPQPGSVIIGLTSEFRVPVDMQELSIIMRVNGEIIRQERRGEGLDGDPLVFPTELAFEDLPEGDAVEVELEAFGGEQLRYTLVKRLASTEVVGGKKLLMRVPLETECAPGPGQEATCDAPMTCVTGVCRSAHLSPASLELYDPAWSKPKNDVCKPEGGGDPVVIVGRGQSDFFAIEDGEVAPVEAGPQGGHHIWVALRMKNLGQSGSITSVKGYIPDLDLELSEFKVIFTFDQDEGGFCKLYGLRYQIDTDGVDVDTVLGHAMEVTVTVTESKEGGIGVGKKTVTLSDTIL